MLDYPALAALSAVIREGSFERAAARLNITPSAVSQRVRALEERIGSVLVLRGQPCRPTAIGARLCAHADQVLLLESDVVATLPQLAGADRHRAASLRIAVNADSLATWVPAALAAFAVGTGTMVDLVLDDEGHTAERLRNGEVLAAVTADPAPVQGCRLFGLGALRYLACATPAFMAQHFPHGVEAAALQAAPHLRFDRRDTLQARWTYAALGVPLDAPAHWVPSTQGFVDLALAGLGWGMQIEALVAPHLDAGRLVELMADTPLDVDLHWQVTRLNAARLDRLTAAVRAAARQALRP